MLLIDTTPQAGSPAIAPRVAAASPEAPVFHDASGRRARLVRIGGGVLAALCAAWVAVLLVGSIGTASLPALSAPLAAHPTSGYLQNAASGRPVGRAKTLIADRGLHGSRLSDLD